MRAWTNLIFATILVASLALTACSGSDDNDNTPSDTATQKDNAVAKDVADDESTPADVKTEDNTPVETVEETAIEDAVVVPDGFHTGISAKGYGQFCRLDSECSEFGLTCFNYGPEDVRPICSKECDTNMDCPEYYVCQYKSGFESPVKICMQAPYCSECQDDIQCKLAGMKCVTDETGGNFCSYACDPGVPGCPAGSHCVFSQDRADWYCQPFYGSCLGDGTQCAPCRIEDQRASGHHCINLAFDAEYFCSKECTDYHDCPAGSDCFGLGTPTGLCLMIAGDQGIPGCHTATQEFCHECKAHHECKEGMLCYLGPNNTGYYCAPECKSDSDCLPGTTCAGSLSIDGSGFFDGFVCRLQDGVTCKQLREEESTPDE